MHRDAGTRPVNGARITTHLMIEDPFVVDETSTDVVNEIYKRSKLTDDWSDADDK